MRGKCHRQKCYSSIWEFNSKLLSTVLGATVRQYNYQELSEYLKTGHFSSSDQLTFAIRMGSLNSLPPWRRNPQGNPPCKVTVNTILIHRNRHEIYLHERKEDGSSFPASISSICIYYLTVSQQVLKHPFK